MGCPQGQPSRAQAPQGVAQWADLVHRLAVRGARRACDACPGGYVATASAVTGAQLADRGTRLLALPLVAKSMLAWLIYADVLRT
jgi:hypothetical protein